MTFALYGWGLYSVALAIGQRCDCLRDLKNFDIINPIKNIKRQ